MAANGAAGSLVDSTHVRAGIGSNNRIAVGGDELDAGQTVNVSNARGSLVDASRRRRRGVGWPADRRLDLGGQMQGSTSATVGQGVVFGRRQQPDRECQRVGGQHRQDQVHRASGGGALAGVNAGLSWSQNDATVNASIGDDTLLPDGGVALHATHAARSRPTCWHHRRRRVWPWVPTP